MQERAERLVRELLSDDEYHQLTERGYLEIPSPTRAGRTYRVPRYRGQVKVYENGVFTESLCVQSIEPIPPG